MSIRALLSVFVVAAGAVMQAEAPAGPLKPVEAELLTRVTPRGVKPGDTVYARVAADWNGPGCRLRRGATVAATVRSVAAHSHSLPSAITLAFDRAECNDGGLQAYLLILEAVGSATDPVGEITADLPDPGRIVPRTVGPDATGLRTMRLYPAAQRTEILPTLRAGEVRGIPGLQLAVGTGAAPVSVVSDRSRDVHVEMHSRLLLRPARLLSVPTAPVVPGEGAAEVFLQKPPVTIVEPEEGADDDGCNPPGCTLVARGGEDQDQVYASSLPLRQLGYTSRENREILEPSQDEALAWLGRDELLVAFNPHLLVPRYASGNHLRAIRVIRAVLFDTTKHKVERTEDWNVTDRGQFLWHLPDNRVLVHLGNELRVLGAGMHVEKCLQLAGPLGFARVSPDGKLLALGVIRERHTPELHAKLVDELGDYPAEDMQVLLMNDDFETIGSVLANSDRMPPILLNEGQVSLFVKPAPEGRLQRDYVLQLHSWDHSVRTLAQVTSTCTPEFSSLPPDLVFLVSCRKSSTSREYRVLRPDGRPVIHGDSLLRDLGHAAGAGGVPGTFAVRIFRSVTATMPGEPFHASNLESAELVIYRCTDGKRLFSVRAKDPAASSAGYAVSPSGDVAILTREDVDVYRVPQK